MPTERANVSQSECEKLYSRLKMFTKMQHSEMHTPARGPAPLDCGFDSCFLCIQLEMIKISGTESG